MVKHSNDLATAVANDKFVHKFNTAKMSDGSLVTSTKAYKEFYDKITEKDVDKTIVGKAYDSVNRFSKFSNFFGNFFHHNVLTQSAFSVSAKGTAKALKGDYRLSKNKELASRAAEDGTQFGALSDAQTNEVESFLDKIIKEADEAYNQNGGDLEVWTSTLTKGFKKLNDANNKLLWEYLHNSYKLMSYDTQCNWYKKEFKTDTVPKKVRQEIAQLTNDFFGGQIHSNIGLSKKDILWLQRLLLSPDWNISAGIRQPLSALCNAPMQRALNLIASKSEKGRKLREICRRVGLSSINNSVRGAEVRGKRGRIVMRNLAIVSTLSSVIITTIGRMIDKDKNPEYYTDDTNNNLTPWHNNKFSVGDEGT